jgi:hypothetical protein
MNACELIQTVGARGADGGQKGLLAMEESYQHATNCRGMATQGH